MRDEAVDPAPPSANGDAEPAAEAEMSQNVSLCLTQKVHLSDRQRLAMELILAGKTDVHVAKTVGVCRRTVCRWRHDDSDFIAELNRRRRCQWDGIEDKLRALLDPAVDVLADQLNDRYDPTRFRAAVTLLRLADVKTAIAVEES